MMRMTGWQQNVNLKIDIWTTLRNTQSRRELWITLNKLLVRVPQVLLVQRYQLMQGNRIKLN